MKPLLLCAAVLPVLAGCAGLAQDPASVDFRGAVGADDWPIPAPEPLAVPVLDLPARGLSAEELRDWCEALGSDDPERRDRAMTGLASAGPGVIRHLAPLRASEDAEVAARVGVLIERILFGNVDALRRRLSENFPPDDPIVSVLEAPLDLRLENRESALAILAGLRDAGLRGGLGNPAAKYQRGLSDLFRVLAGGPLEESEHRRRAAGYDDPGDPEALAAFARIAERALRSRDREIRKAALAAISTLSVGWQASLFRALFAQAAGDEPDLADRALEIIASAARAGADGSTRSQLFPISGPPIGPTNVASELARFPYELLAFAADPQRSLPARLWALEAASYSGETRLAGRIAKLAADPRFELPVFHALVALGGPEAEAAILGAFEHPSDRIPAEDAEAAAARRGMSAVIPFLVSRTEDRARACAVVGAVATRDHGGTLAALLGRSTEVEEVRPLLGAVVRLSPLPEPHDAATLGAIRALLTAEKPDLRFLAACAISAVHGRAGIAAWGRLLHDGAMVTVTWRGWHGSWSIEEHAAGALEQLVGMSLDTEDRLSGWRDWWEENHADYEAE